MALFATPPLGPVMLINEVHRQPLRLSNPTHQETFDVA
jgi:hypothetical protein